MTFANIQSLVYALTKTNTTSLPAATLNLYTQPAQDRITSLIIQADGRWQWDDDNQQATDQGGGLGGQQNGTTALVSGQQDYSFPVSYLKINRIECKPNGGTFFYKLFPRDVDDAMWGAKLLGLDTTSQSAPQYYDITAHSVFLYPIPNYSQTASLKFYFQRGTQLFDYTLGTFVDGTGSTSSVPGFANLFHPLVAYLAAYNYCVANIPELAAGYFATTQRMEAELKNYYAWRNHDDPSRLAVRSIRFR